MNELPSPSCAKDKMVTKRATGKEDVLNRDKMSANRAGLQRVRMCVEGEEVSISCSLPHAPVPVHRGNLYYVNVGKQVVL